MRVRRPFRKSGTLRAAWLLLAVFAGASARALPPPLPLGESPHLTMGNPSKATPDPANAANFLVRKPLYALSYNKARGTPNWVSWRLAAADLGMAARFSFQPDLTLPPAFPPILPTDYTGSGFDRGHMCPHGDRTLNNETSKATFLMTNIVPQSPANNQKAWAQIEVYCRRLVLFEAKEIYLIDGPSGLGGSGRNGWRDKIGRQHPVAVPAKTWKVILIVDAFGMEGVTPLQQVGRGARIISVIVPNDMTVTDAWGKYRVSVRDVEKETGFTFFDNVPREIIDPLKKIVDAGDAPVVDLYHNR